MNSSRVQVAAVRPSSSGIATFTEELAEALQAAGCQIELFALSGATVQPHLGWTTTQFGGSLDRLEHVLGPVPAYWWLSRRLSKRWKTSDSTPRIVTLPPLGITLSRESFVAVAWGYGDIKEELKRAMREVPKGLALIAGARLLMYRGLDVVALKRAKEVVALTTSSAQWWSRRLGKTVHPLSAPVSMAPERERQPAGYEPVEILFISRDLNIKRKNLRLLIDALNRLPSTVLARLRLNLCGGGDWPRGALDPALRAGLKLHTSGALSRAEVRSTMSQADILVSPSTYEELGYVVLEGLAAGLAIVASRIPTFLDLIGNDAGLFVDPKDSTELSAVLMRLVNSPADVERFGSRGLVRWQQRFRPDVAGEAFRDVLFTRAVR